MTDEKAYDFVHTLSAPEHVEGLRDRALQPDPDDVVVTNAWRVLVPENPDEIVRTASADFLDFMRISMGEKLEAESCGPGNDAPAIVIKSGGHTDLVKKQSFTIHPEPHRITIDAGGSVGVLYALFLLEELFAERRAPYIRQERLERRPLFGRRVLRAYHAPYYTNELDARRTFYPDGYLARLARQTYNGVWIHQRLMDLAPTPASPKSDPDREPRLAKLNDLIQRASRFGIGVYIYLNEPRALPADHPFYRDHPDAKGHVYASNVMEGEGPYAAMCTESPVVKRSLVQGTADLFRGAPGLAGVILITMSEHLTHCWSHVNAPAGARPDCPRCAERDPAAVVAETVNLIAQGAHQIAPESAVIAWTWSWDGAEEVPHERIIGALSDDVIVMADFERGQQIEKRGRKWYADEYMLSFPGPTDDFQSKCRLAAKLERETYAKIQIGNTHELVTVPYIPVPFNLAEKFLNMRAENVTGYMGCWIFGGYPSIMTALAGRYSWELLPESVDDYLKNLASTLYGQRASDRVVAAWRKMSHAFREYPFSQHLVYWGPMNYTCIYPFRLKSISRKRDPSWILHDDFGDSPDWAKLGLADGDDPTFIREQFDLLVTGWREGLADLTQALKEAPRELKDRASRDFGVAEATMLHLDSTAGIIRFLQAHERFEAGGDPAEAIAAMKNALEHELSNRRRLLEITRADSRIGFHSEAGYWYRPETIENAIVELEKTLSDDLPGLARRKEPRS